MARTLAELPKGARITDYISLGVVAKSFPRERIERRSHDPGGQSSPARPAGPRGRVLRHRPGAVHAGLVSRGPAVLAGRARSGWPGPARP